MSRWANAGKIAVAGIGFSDIVRRTDIPLGRFAMDAARAAVADCGLELSAIDGLATFPLAPFMGAANRNGEDVITPEFFLAMPEFGNVRWFSQAGDGMIVAAVHDATNALLAGVCDYAMVWRAMYVPSGTYGVAGAGGSGAYGSVGQTADGDEQFSAPYGCASPIQWHALRYRNYLEKYGKSRESMATLAVNSRRNANRNEHAIFADRALSEQEYLDSRMISDPLCLFDCDVPVTGCVAVIMTTAQRARDLVHPPAYLGGVALQTSVQQPTLQYALQDHTELGSRVSDKLWRMSGLTKDDIDVAELYDGFGPSTLYWLESAGFCGPGEALDFVQGGRVALDGELPLNTFGGSLSEGRLHGMGHIAEAVLQLRGGAGTRQVRDAQAALVMDGSPMLRGGGIVFTAQP